MGDVRGCSPVFMAAIVSVVCARRPLSSSGRHPTDPLVHPPSPPTLLPENRHPTIPLPASRPPVPAAHHPGGKLLENSRPLWDPLSSVATPARARSFFCFVFRGTFGCPSDLCLFCHRSLLPPPHSLPTPRSPDVLLKSHPTLSASSPVPAREGDEFCLARSTLYLANFPSPSHFSSFPTVYRLFRIHAFAI